MLNVMMSFVWAHIVMIDANIEKSYSGKKNVHPGEPEFLDEIIQLADG